jgi:Secretion system C-terminal sorting domain
MKNSLMSNCTAIINAMRIEASFLFVKNATFKRLYTLFILMLISISTASAQSSIANYTTTNGTASMQSMTNSIRIIDPTMDDTASIVIKIGFDFWFMGERYTLFSANSNGAIRLGKDAISGKEYIGSGANVFPQSNRTIIAPFLANLSTFATSGQVHYVVTGTEPNRKLTVEFYRMKIKNTSSSYTGTFQVSLNESSGVINFDYSPLFTVGTVAGFDAVVGLNYNNATNTVKTVDQTSYAGIDNNIAPSIATYNTASAILPLQNKRITFTPPTVANITGALTVSGITATSMDLSWTDIAGEQGYVIYGSRDNVNFTFYNQTAPNVTTATINAVIPATKFYWKVYAISEGKLSATPVTNNATSIAAGAITTNSVTIATEGTTSYPKPHFYSWKSLPWTNGLPKATQNVEIIFDIPAATKHEVIELYLDEPNITVNNLTIRNINASAAYVKIINTHGLSNITVLGDLIIKSPGGNKYNRALLGNLGVTTVYGKTYLGSASPSLNEGHGSLGSASILSFGQRINLYDDMYVYPRGFTTEEWSIFHFLKTGTQYLFNETLVTDTVRPVMFQNLYVGINNATVAKSTNLIFAGAAKDAYVQNLGGAAVTIYDSSTMDLPKTYSLTKYTGANGATFNMQPGAKLRLGGFSSIDRTGADIGVPGSNFPNGFTYSLLTGSTIEYYGDNSATQTIHTPGGFNYKKLLVNNNGGVITGRAQKIITSLLRDDDSFTIQDATDVTLGNICTGYPGNITIQVNGGLYCGPNVVASTGGTFTMQNNSYLGIGHAEGITTTGLFGNIQMTGVRAYNTTGNYIYNGTVAQVTGNGLPSTAINSLTIDNATTVINSQNVLVNAATNLKQGVFDIVTTKFTSNGTNGILGVVTGKMKANKGIVEMKGTSGTEQNLSGNWFVGKNIGTLINANTKGVLVAAVPADTLLISYALKYGAVTNSSIITNDNLTLLSRDTGTANFGEVVNGSGNTIVGKVNIERYLFGQKSWRFLAAPVQLQVNDASTPSIATAWRESSAAHISTGYGVQMTGPSGPAVASPLGELDLYTVRGSLKYYNDTNNLWTEIANTTATKLANKGGYMVFVRGDKGAANTVSGAGTTTNLRVKGTIRTGDQTFSVLANKFQAVGNPFPSRFDMRTTDKNNISTSFTVWNPAIAGLFNVGGYETYILSGGNYTKVGSPSTIRNYVESGEAIFVQSNVASAGSLIIKESDKGNGSSLQSRVGVTVPTMEINFYVKDALGNDILEDAAVINFDNNYSQEIDNDDVRKIFNANNNLSIKKPSTSLIVEKRPLVNENDTIQLNLSNTKIANYSFVIDPSAMQVNNATAFLEDKYLQTKTPLSLTDVNTYNFAITNIAGSQVADRFKIVFKKQAVTNFTFISALRNTDKTITINWGVANEKNVVNYEVERSNEGVNFEKVLNKTAVYNNNMSYIYTKIDDRASVNANWYRVKLINTMGEIKYSAIAMVNAKKEAVVNSTSTIALYPNPIVDNTVNLSFTHQQKGKYIADVYTATGQKLSSTIINVKSEVEQTAIQLSNLSKGNYNVIVIDEQGKKTTLPFLVK